VEGGGGRVKVGWVEGRGGWRVGVGVEGGGGWRVGVEGRGGWRVGAGGGWGWVEGGGGGGGVPGGCDKVEADRVERGRGGMLGEGGLGSLNPKPPPPFALGELQLCPHKNSTFAYWA
jgi:hypothetical protein